MNLKKIRKNQNLTQQQVADKLNISRMKYNHYELGNSEPNIDTLIDLADLFHLTIDELVGHEVPYLIDKGLLSNEQLDVIEKIKSLDKEQCKLLATYIDGLKDGKKR